MNEGPLEKPLPSPGPEGVNGISLDAPGNRFQSAPASYLWPDWPAPSRVKAVSTTRLGGNSRPPFESFNLGAHVGDEPVAVLANRRKLSRDLNLPAEPAWLRQVHGSTVAVADRTLIEEADGVIARESDRVCVVMTADCLPVLLCDKAATCVGVVHAGWRGLARGVIAASVALMGCAPGDMLAWLGPAIGPAAFEVDDEVRATFMGLDSGCAECFRPSPTGRWMADIYGLARRQLGALGVVAVYGGDRCTFSERERFFSYRRDGRTGRMASLIWLAG